MVDNGDVHDDGTVDILYLVDRLEELVGMGKRVPFSGRVMVEEEEFLALVDQLRVAVPNEIKQAQRVIKERERIIGESQEEATKILEGARSRAAYFVSQEGVLNEARQQGEEILRLAEESRKRSIGEIDVYALKQLSQVEEAMRHGMEILNEAMRESATVMEVALRETTATLEEARSQVGQ